MKKRKYQLKRRAARQQETRERIVDAAIALHEEIGPAATTVSALAERAGVQRLTVYKYFPTEPDVLAACSAKWLGAHPPPAIDDMPAGESAERTRAVLAALYGYYRGTQNMWVSLYRDRGKLEALEAPMAQFDAYLEGLRTALLAGLARRRSKTVRVTLGHVLRFSTWRSLADEGLEDAAMAALAADWVQGGDR
jgi:AcrR family transcriptional regulator